MKNHYYGITFNLEIISLGEHEDFDGASQIADSLGDVMYIAQADALAELKENISKILC